MHREGGGGMVGSAGELTRGPRICSHHGVISEGIMGCERVWRGYTMSIWALGLSMVCTSIIDMKFAKKKKVV